MARRFSSEIFLFVLLLLREFPSVATASTEPLVQMHVLGARETLRVSTLTALLTDSHLHLL
jgi:hypothetical protein